MARNDMKEIIKLERKIYEEMKAREDASRQREADETANMFNEPELARLQAENERLRAFVEDHIINSNTFMMGRELWTQLQQQARELLASLQTGGAPEPLDKEE